MRTFCFGIWSKKIGINLLSFSMNMLIGFFLISIFNIILPSAPVFQLSIL